MKIIDYLFFKFFKLWKNSSIAEISVYAAVLFLAIFLNCNIHTMWGVLEQYKLVIYPTESMYYISLCVVFLLFLRIFTLLLCFYLGWKKRYKFIIEKFDNLPHSGNLFLLLLYIFFSLSLFVLEAFYSKGKI